MTKYCAFAIAAGLFFFQANGKAAEPPRVERATPPRVPFSAKVPEGLEWEVAITPREESKKTSEPVATAGPLSGNQQRRSICRAINAHDDRIVKAAQPREPESARGIRFLGRHV